MVPKLVPNMPVLKLKGPLPSSDKDFARFGHLIPESTNAILVLSRHTGITLRAL